MTLNKATVLSLALALILFSALGLSEGRKWKLEKNQFPSMSCTGEYKVMGEEDNDNHGSLLQLWGVKSPASAPSVEAFMPGHSPRAGHPVHPPMLTGGNYEVMMAKEGNDELDFFKQPRVVEPPAPAPVEEAISPTCPSHVPGIGHPVHPPSYPVAAFRPTSPGHSPGARHKEPPPASNPLKP